MKAIILFALVLTLLASTQAVYVPTLPSCTNYYSGVNQTCADNNSQCLGDSFCAEDRCIPKQIFIGQQCAHHYECYRGFSDPNENPAIYCDKTENKCKFAKEVKETCQKNIECQSNRCVSGVCVRVKAGDACKQESDCKPFDGELLGCHPIDEKCIALPTIGEQCIGGECDSSSWCVNNTCVALDYKKEGDSCTINDDIPSDICRPTHDGSSGTYLKCIDNVCTYPPRLRESCTGPYGCVADYAEECGGDYDTCQKTECYSDTACGTNQFCDCTNNVCMSKTYGNMVHECSYVDGLRAPQATAFTKCLKEKCPDTIYTSSSIMLNTKSCPYQKCRSQYKENVRCVREAGKEYGAENVYFFGVSSASLSGLSPMIAVLLIIFNVAFMF